MPNRVRVTFFLDDKLCEHRTGLWSMISVVEFRLECSTCKKFIVFSGEAVTARIEYNPDPVKDDPKLVPMTPATDPEQFVRHNLEITQEDLKLARKHGIDLTRTIDTKAECKAKEGKEEK